MNNKTNYGWECPKCGAVMSPYKDVCVNCTGEIDEQFAKSADFDAENKSSHIEEQSETEVKVTNTIAQRPVRPVRKIVPKGAN